MECPKCLEKTKVLETRKNGSCSTLWVQRLKEDWPDLVYRRRLCLKCENRFSTIELPIEDLKAIMIADR